MQVDLNLVRIGVAQRQHFHIQVENNIKFVN